MNIRPGMTRAEVIRAEGMPTKTAQVDGVEIWEYALRKGSCRVTFQNDAVTDEPSCSGNGSAARAFAAGLQGAGQGMQNQNKPVHCTSTNYGYQTQTDCQ
jgi:hypothetical protein